MIFFDPSCIDFDVGQSIFKPLTFYTRFNTFITLLVNTRSNLNACNSFRFNSSLVWVGMSPKLPSRVCQRCLAMCKFYNWLIRSLNLLIALSPLKWLSASKKLAGVMGLVCSLVYVATQVGVTDKIVNGNAHTFCLTYQWLQHQNGDFDSIPSQKQLRIATVNGNTLILLKMVLSTALAMMSCAIMPSDWCYHEHPSVCHWCGRDGGCQNRQSRYRLDQCVRLSKCDCVIIAQSTATKIIYQSRVSTNMLPYS